jgi:hypothetical protein
MDSPNTLTDGVPKVPKGALRASVTFGTASQYGPCRMLGVPDNEVDPGEGSAILLQLAVRLRLIRVILLH